MTLLCTQGHRVTRKLENLCCHFVIKFHETTKMFLMVNYKRRMTLKKSCRYGEYGSFEHLLVCFVSGGGGFFIGGRGGVFLFVVVAVLIGFVV